MQFSMTIDADYEDETNLLYKFVKDIKDTLTGDKPIDAAGNEAGNKGYYGYGDVTWDTRRNKGDYSTQLVVIYKFPFCQLGFLMILIKS